MWRIIIFDKNMSTKYFAVISSFQGDFEPIRFRDISLCI